MWRLRPHGKKIARHPQTKVPRKEVEKVTEIKGRAMERKVILEKVEKKERPENVTTAEMIYICSKIAGPKEVAKATAKQLMKSESQKFNQKDFG